MCIYILHYSTAVPSSAPVNLQGNAVSSTAIQLQWELPPLADQNGVVRSYHINISVTETESVFQLTSETNSLNISGLRPYYTYNITVAAVTIGPGPYGIVLTITMPEDGMDCCLTSACSSLGCIYGLHYSTAVPSSAPVNLQGNAFNSTTIQLQWESPPLADQNGAIHSYYINMTVTETGLLFLLTSETNSLNISDLHPFYTYTITVAAVTIGPGPYSVAFTVTMPEDGMDSNCCLNARFLCISVPYSPLSAPSSAPVNLQGSAVNSTTIQLQWELPPLAYQNGVIRSYLINISVAETGSVFQLTSKMNSLNISSLHPYYTYNITVAAVTISPGPYGVLLTIRMPEDGMDTFITWLPFFFTYQVLIVLLILVGQHEVATLCKSCNFLH